MAQARFVVLGGGPSGMMAALEYARRTGAGALILEKNTSLGKKLLLTGAGRCNLSNCNLTHGSYPRGGASRLVMELLQAWPYERLEEYFGELGLELVSGAGHRVFPRADKARTVLSLLLLALDEAGVEVRTNTRVTGLEPLAKGGFRLRTTADTYRASRVVLAMGGRSYPQTGSSGEGYDLATGLGHTIVPPLPALVPLRVRLGPLHKLQGQKWFVGLCLRRKDTDLAATSGDVVVTDYGLSGLGILDITARLRLSDYRDVSLVLDFFPHLGAEGLEQSLCRRARRHGHRTLAQLLLGLVPERMARTLATVALGEAAGESAERLGHSGLARAASSLTSVTVDVSKDTGFAHAQITSGGVCLDEIHPASFESRLVPGLYIVGELLDVHGLSGGFNLHAAWASGLVAGEAAARQLSGPTEGL